MRILRAFRKASKVIHSPARYTVAGKEIRCSHCGGTTFFFQSAQLNTAWRTFLDIDWLDESASILVCSTCAHLEWFLKKPQRLPGETTSR